ncbi:NAD(P)-dependent oxidoreductase [Paenarthrobacter sp. YAF11_1]|uniref:NAD(P)-dependent oxidoreductase n=1 Tax=Paenarthrobacter sp. YAF11_1 TaxID=3233074 RepID=UPI003F98B95F
MARITVLGGTGYTGSNIVKEAARRGHEVTSYSRKPTENPERGVSYVTASLIDSTERERAVADADVVVATLAPRGEMEAGFVDLYDDLATLASASGARFGVIGGFGSLRPFEGGPRMAFGDDVPAEYAAEGQTLATIAENLEKAAPKNLDWFFISPAAGYGSYAPGEATGRYRVGGDVVQFDENGQSFISGADFALAVLDEIDTPAHRRAQFSVMY